MMKITESSFSTAQRPWVFQHCSHHQLLLLLCLHLTIILILRLTNSLYFLLKTEIMCRGKLQFDFLKSKETTWIDPTHSRYLMINSDSAFLSSGSMLLFILSLQLHMKQQKNGVILWNRWLQVILWINTS